MKLITGISHHSVLCSLGLLRYKGSWPPWVEQVYGRHFSKRVCSPHVPVSHLVIHTTFKTFYYYYTCYAALWSLIYHYDSLRGFPASSVVKNLPVILEMLVWSLRQDHPLEKELATHSSILAWRIPWTEETGGLQSMGSQWVWHDLATKQQHYDSLKA